MKPTDFNSPAVIFHRETQEHIIKRFTEPKIINFFSTRGIDLDKIAEIKSSTSITDINFKTVDMKYFYTKLFKGIKKKENSIFYTITHDKNLAILKCEETGISYNKIYLGKVPIYYFIYFDIQEIFDVVREYAKEYKGY